MNGLGNIAGTSFLQRMLRFSSFALVLGGLLVPPAAAASRTDVRGDIPVKQIPAVMAQALVPGLQMAVLHDGTVALYHFGIADVQSGRAVTDDTVFEAASLSKPVFAYGVLLLASRGKIDLDAPVGRYLDGVSPEVARLTARRLLSHSAGIALSRDGKPAEPRKGSSHP
ncbi:beta-lactamase family protein [Sphingomonas sp. BN140010]|uniref:Beta-lactamase family protein n=1 Tax=Sphingomonas arvum TaxID=2992113 RepID=A0ABT3JBU6_9SPHN|nr:serine hydrolase domain-containing protein [Sphingomonas sp. BN140010]MCW3796501.1 beta-lactamase family protein [Sphingomonas sp. BN140010]